MGSRREAAWVVVGPGFRCFGKLENYFWAALSLSLARSGSLCWGGEDPRSGRGAANSSSAGAVVDVPSDAGSGTALYEREAMASLTR